MSARNRSTKNTTTKRAPSRAPKLKRARRIIRNYLRAATIYNAPEVPNDIKAIAAVQLELANANLATLKGYDVEEGD